jgi:hypothetical protein
MLAKTYAAFKAAGVSDNDTQATAEELADYETRLGSIDNRLARVETGLDAMRQVLVGFKTEVAHRFTVLTWAIASMPPPRSPFSACCCGISLWCERVPRRRRGHFLWLEKARSVNAGFRLPTPASLPLMPSRAKWSPPPSGLSLIACPAAITPTTGCAGLHSARSCRIGKAAWSTHEKPGDQVV